MQGKKRNRKGTSGKHARIVRIVTACAKAKEGKRSRGYDKSDHKKSDVRSCAKQEKQALKQKQAGKPK